MRCSLCGRQSSSLDGVRCDTHCRLSNRVKADIIASLLKDFSLSRNKTIKLRLVSASLLEWICILIFTAAEVLVLIARIHMKLCITTEFCLAVLRAHVTGHPLTLH